VPTCCGLSSHQVLVEIHQFWVEINQPLAIKIWLNSNQFLFKINLLLTGTARLIFIVLEADMSTYHWLHERADSQPDLD
jgi:hypothetical protein